MTHTANTIFALATAPGKSGVAIIRISGPEALTALGRLTELKSPAPRMAHYTALTSPDGEIIDRALAITFKAPNSFTGEDVVELHIHGSLAVIRQLLDVLNAISGLRHAEPGEFTRRAFLNGKMDLIEAEGLADLIDAETVAQKTQALRQMQGELSGFYEGLRARMTKILAHLEAYIDFPDEEIPEHVLTELADNTKSLCADIEKALQDGGRGERLRDGLSIVILGAPNAGKSSLLNVIARRDAAIVSHRAGTTRDIIETHLDIAGYPVALVDTAGLRDSNDDIEAEGIRRALQRAQDADIKLVLFDASLLPGLDEKSLSLVDEGVLVVINKSDIAPNQSENLISSYKPLYISTKTGQGIDALMAEIQQRIISRFSANTPSYITRTRHRALLSAALQELEKSLPSKALELRCEDLRKAALSVGKITGKIQVDDVLDVIFSQFCIGK